MPDPISDQIGVDACGRDGLAITRDSVHQAVQTAYPECECWNAESGVLVPRGDGNWR
jgi:hypothetical protein